jgi:hypothetical protein
MADTPKPPTTADRVTSGLTDFAIQLVRYSGVTLDMTGDH